jgi:hypothetical protein
MKAPFPASDMLAAICPVDRDNSDRVAQYASPGQWQVLAGKSRLLASFSFRDSC